MGTIESESFFRREAEIHLKDLRHLKVYPYSLISSYSYIDLQCVRVCVCVCGTHLVKYKTLVLFLSIYQ